MERSDELHRRIPLAVLKPRFSLSHLKPGYVAQANTACGIETRHRLLFRTEGRVAQANTACGIETVLFRSQSEAATLHRRIPLAVLKLHELALTEVNLGYSYIFHTKNTTRKIEWYFCVEMQCEHPYRENLLKTLC